MTTPQQTTIAKLLSVGSHNGWALEPNLMAGAHYFRATRRSAKRVEIEHVHVALDGSIRYSDADRFGELWSLGVSG